MTARDATRSIQNLLNSLQTLSPRLEGRKDDLQFLQNLVNSNEFHSLMQVHHEVNAATSSESTPVCTNALTLCHSLSYDIETNTHPEAQELFDLLTSPHIDSLMSTHDRVANKEYPVVNSTAVHTSPMCVDDDSIKTVRIDKEEKPLGATVKTSKNGKVFISRVLHGGAADKSGLLHAGDVVEEINGTSVYGFTVDQVADLMTSLRGTVVFKVIPAISDSRPKRRSQSSSYVRSYFSYDPEQDKKAPCREAGLKFEKGDILQIMNQDDPNWWQAIQYNNQGNQAGIIPSKTLKEKWMYMELVSRQPPSKRKNKTKKSLYSSFESAEFGEAAVTYEEVVKIEPQLRRPRPIVLVAPRGGPFNMEALRTKIVQNNPERFGSPIPHTSRPALAGEGGKYTFVSRQQMERDIQKNQFVEHGYFNGHYYGTSINSIRDIINAGKTCILVLIPQAIKLVRTGDLKPFVVYCRAPSHEGMQKNWVPKGMIKESHIPDILRQAESLERTYSRYFDHTILFSDLDAAIKEVIHVADRLASEDQWVPTTWLDTKT